MDRSSLLEQLVSKLTSLQPNSSEWKSAVKKADYTLRYDKCTSTSEQEVTNRLNGLAEKFSIKGHHDLSKALLTHNKEFLKSSRPLGEQGTNQSILKYDALQLLLSLSSSSNQDYNYIPTIKHTAEKILTWQDVIDDSPLEGDHWQTWPENEEDSEEDEEDDDDDDYELNQDNIAAATTATTPHKKTPFGDLSNFKFDFTSKLKLDKREDQEGLNHLVSQQYWRSEYRLPRQDITHVNLLQKPCQMSDALERIIYSEAERNQLKTISEANIIREVLSLLRGYRSVVYVYQEGQFVLNQQYILQHLSQNALGHLLQEFCQYGNMIAELRQLCNKTIHNIQYGQTNQAFAATLFQSLMDFDSTLSVAELNSSIITSNATRSISLLQLRNTLDPSLQSFTAIYDIAADAPYSQGNARSISTYLIAALYDRALVAQSSGQQAMYDTLLFVLEKTLVPYGEIMDDWVFYGSLQCDKAHEFFVSRRDDVSMQDSNFWVDGFSIASIATRDYTCFPCPLFDPAFMNRIFFTGKAVNLLGHIERHNQHMDPIQRSFQSLMQEHVCVKPAFIKPVKLSTPQATTSPVEFDLVTSALFPIQANSTRRDQQPLQEQPQASDMGSLLDQDIIKCIDAYIEQPYNKAADTLNNVLHQGCGLTQQLQSLASIYLMLENDLMHSFCEALYAQMDNRETWCDSRILNRTFAESSKVSGYDETVYIDLASDPSPVTTSKSTTQAAYLEMIQFNVKISWPLNNFIQQEHLPSYSKIQRFLFRLKRAKYVMEKKTLFRGRFKMEKSDARAMRFYSIRMRILWFINAFWRYMMTTILHAETINFRDKLSISKDADEITALHNSYVRRIVDRCLLNEKASAIKKSIISIFDMAEQMMLMFQCYMQSTALPLEKDLLEFDMKMSAVEKDFTRANEFISISLTILGKKGGFPWFESLAASLSAQ
ncbi:Spc98 family-domain-containing protein [Mucor lusitanicus]|uniref:Spindle pole body component n=1 Tax=Mucor circinelloides f. lusitanicus TaxID=29924 RepID=A0A8H4EXM0_MUCCL|nr:Spc98 family-domain-containing protein [Mucor lusitanicus]